jgi:hypothetical protein
MSNSYERFLEALGFTEPRQTSRRDVIELVVHDALKPARKALRSGIVRFLSIGQATTTKSTVQEFYAIQDRKTVGRLRLESFNTHSVIHLTDLQ